MNRLLFFIIPFLLISISTSAATQLKCGDANEFVLIKKLDNGRIHVFYSYYPSDFQMSVHSELKALNQHGALRNIKIATDVWCEKDKPIFGLQCSDFYLWRSGEEIDTSDIKVEKNLGIFWKISVSNTQELRDIYLHEPTLADVLDLDITTFQRTFYLHQCEYKSE